MAFSVLMSVYQRDNPTFLKQAIESLLKQTLLPSEIVIVKDGELSDELDNVIDIYRNENLELFKIFRLETNQGLGKALSFGIEKCTHQLIARMDSDDICFDDRFEKQVSFLVKHSGISVVGSFAEEFNTTPGDLGRLRVCPLTEDNIASYAKYRNPLNHPTVMMRKKDVLSVGSYLDMPLFEDYYLWVRMIVHGFRLANIPQALLYFRVGNDMVGRRHGFSYVKKEFLFLQTIHRQNFITRFDFYKSILIKSPLRIIPKKLLSVVYRNFLRRKSS